MNVATASRPCQIKVSVLFTDLAGSLVLSTLTSTCSDVLSFSLLQYFLVFRRLSACSMAILSSDPVFLALLTQVVPDMLNIAGTVVLLGLLDITAGVSK